MCHPDRMLSRTPRLLAALALTLVGATAVSCGGGSDGGKASGDPAAVLATAKATLDDTSGVHITLSTDDLPEGVTGIVRADGDGTHAPAFDGSITVKLLGQSVDVPVIAVDGVVYAKLPFTSSFQDIDPGEYGAPDPAALFTSDAGLSSLLPATTSLKAGASVRGGEGNREVLTTYTGTVAGTTVSNFIPSASGDFDATYTVADDGELRQLVLTGEFYDHADASTYTIGFDDYGSSPDISAP